jgi:hypothetical protein
MSLPIFSMLLFAAAVLVMAGAILIDNHFHISMAIPAIALLLSTLLWLVGLIVASVGLARRRSRSRLGLLAWLLNGAPTAVLIYFVIWDWFHPSSPHGP